MDYHDSPQPPTQKVWLDAWYQREGYVKGATEDFASAYPRIAQILVPCVFTCYRKELRPA